MSLHGGHTMTAWSALFGDELCTTSGGEQSTFPTDDHLSGKDHCLVVVGHEDCPHCPRFFSDLQGIKNDLGARAVGLVCLFQAGSPQEHLRVGERYGEVHIPTAFPTPADLLQKKRYLSELIGKRVP